MARKRTKPTQKEQVLRYLKTHAYITRIESFYELGVCELSSRIGELENDGYKFNRQPVTIKNANGVTVTIKKYSLKED